VVVCLVAAVTHGFYYLGSPEIGRWPDEAEYVALGLHLEESGELRLPTGEAAKRMPLYPAFLAAIHYWQGPTLWENSVLAIQALLAWCSTIIIALIAERLADGRAGWIAGGVAAVYSPRLLLQTSFLTETILVFLVLLALWLYISVGIAARSTIARSTGLLGVSLALGLGVLTRANALLFIVPFAVDAACRAGSRRRCMTRVGLILVPALICACCWAARNSRELGSFTLSTSGGLNFYLGHNAQYAINPGLGHDTDYQAFERLRREGLTEVEADRSLYREGLAFLTANPGTTVSNALRKTVVWLRTSVRPSGPLTLVIGLGAVAAGGWRPWRRGLVAGVRRSVYLAALAGLVASALLVVLALQESIVPWTTPRYVVPLGMIGLLLLRGRPNVRGLLIGLFASQWVVAMAFIPLTRVRWVVDPILIVAIGVGFSRMCEWLSRPPARGSLNPSQEAGPLDRSDPECA
jgi:4-amino-4-deoxy-L-arabinose transferase-like glycosyltransferase